MKTLPVLLLVIVLAAPASAELVVFQESANIEVVEAAPVSVGRVKNQY